MFIGNNIIYAMPKHIWYDKSLFVSVDINPNVKMVQENSLSKVLVICGATASGKTALAVECAKNFNGEVVSADSMCIYRGLDIGTAKPTEEEKQGIPHYMIDVAGAKDNFSVGDYKERANLILKERS